MSLFKRKDLTAFVGDWKVLWKMLSRRKQKPLKHFCLISLKDQLQVSPESWIESFLMIKFEMQVELDSRFIGVVHQRFFNLFVFNTSSVSRDERWTHVLKNWRSSSVKWLSEFGTSSFMAWGTAGTESCERMYRLLMQLYFPLTIKKRNLNNRFLSNAKKLCRIWEI